jgi:hypothetical protein
VARDDGLRAGSSASSEVHYGRPAMNRINLSQTTLDDLRALVDLQDDGIQDAPWEPWGREPLNDHDALAADEVMTRLRRFDATLANDATIWGRVVFPMLMLAESDGAQAWSQVPLQATVGDVELVGVVDGAIGRPVAGVLDLPWLLVAEAKRGVDATSPQWQLYGELLAAAAVHQRRAPRPVQEVHGCMTVADVFKFVQVELRFEEGQRPRMHVTSSREFSTRTEARTVLAMLRALVHHGLALHGR